MRTITALLAIALPCWAGPRKPAPVDLIPHAELGDQKAALGWKTIGKGVLGVSAEVPERQVVTFDHQPIPEEYDLTLTAERLDARTDDFSVGILVGDHACSFSFDSYDCSKSFLGLIALREHSEYGPGNVFKKGKPRTVKLLVRKTTLEVWLDGKKVYKTKPIDWKDASVSEKIPVKEKGKLFLSATSGSWRITGFSILDVTGATR